MQERNPNGGRLEDDGQDIEGSDPDHVEGEGGKGQAGSAGEGKGSTAEAGHLGTANVRCPAKSTGERNAAADGVASSSADCRRSSNSATAASFLPAGVPAKFPGHSANHIPTATLGARRKRTAPAAVPKSSRPVYEPTGSTATVP